jgi:diadenosine tetraphosphatase ApaH/serine/threonine PP2A family protein phosphatase
VFVRETATLRLDRAKKYLINPGSVGQPRDRNPETSFAIWDSERWIIQFYRIPYAIDRTQASIRRAGLPRVLADRLKYGT